ncbi:AraC family transcriptional regulator [Paenibacillus sp. M1]|uniref:AraC family transcriptional regulator n=1 Tax=Paenibacillus haidiansis TaxID=1574488 RepID=A0ABU7VNL2_9BACL
MNNLKYPERVFPHFRSEVSLFSPHTRHVEKGWICGRHVHHTMLEMLLVLEGSQTAVLGAEEYEQQAGDLIVVSPMQVHDFQARQTERAAFFTMHIHLEDWAFLHRIGARNEGFYPSGHPLNDKLVPLMRNMMDLLYDENGQKMALLRELFAILSHMQDHFFASGEATGNSAFQTELPVEIAREIQGLVLRQNDRDSAADGEAAADWLEDISRRLGISRRHCHRIFREAFGMPPREYLMVLKQQEAMHMLATTSDTIERIAYRIGYENVQSFSRQFAAWTGCTPSDFRKNNTDADRYFHLTPLDTVSS